MAQINLLDSETIDKIAAGEVVERPSSVVKELVENAIDAKATAITVEAKEGGIEFLRVTDNGSGMERTQLRKAFLRHATSKIVNAEDLNHISSLGFRGEALSSIAAVSKVELITKTADSLTGCKIELEGGVEKSFEEVGAPDGTTFIMRNLFFNTPVRRKFLKQASTEGGYIEDLMEHLALSRPDISFKFQLGSQLRFHTSGNGDLKEVIYRIYGREVASLLTPIQIKENGLSIEGYLGKPALVRSNRNFEIYFINGRFIKSSIIAKAIEDGYKEYLMQHKFPLCVLHISMDTTKVDVNVHPTKMDVRFSNGIECLETLSKAIKTALLQREMIPEAKLTSDKEIIREEGKIRKESYKEHAPEPFEIQRKNQFAVKEEASYARDMKKETFKSSPVWERAKQKTDDAYTVIAKNAVTEKNEVVEKKVAVQKEDDDDFFVFEESEEAAERTVVKTIEKPEEKSAETVKEVVGKDEQLNLFDEKILTVENRMKYRIIGQVFDTYWLVEYEDKMLMIDQHAAHEKVKYERFIKQFHEKNVTSQRLMPPIIVSLSASEEVILKEYTQCFVKLGFEIEEFGGNEFALRSVPTDLYGCSEREMFLAVLDDLASGNFRGNYQVVEEKIASMACKAAVKGNNRLSHSEAEKLIDELLTLDNPYNCPHGRPTMVTLSKSEMEKKFKRIV